VSSEIPDPIHAAALDRVHSCLPGIDRLIGKGMGVAFADYDNDGYTDLFISNDTFRNFLLHNNRDGTR
jgi:hypothetical protein